MDYHAKFAILSNEVIRRCLTTKETVSQERKDQIMDEYALKLLRSGYSITQTRQIILSGLRGYLKKVQLASKNGWDLHRSAKSSLASRIKRKTLEKQNWFRPKRKNDHDNRTSKPKHKKKNNLKTAPLKIKSVIFVPRTGSTALCKRLRAEEQNLSRITGYGVKVQERSGTQLRKILCNGKTAWNDVQCQRPWCMVCQGSQGGQGGKGGQCRRRNQTYFTICNFCEQKKKDAEAGVKTQDDTKEHSEAKEDIKMTVWRYGGETGRSLAERSRDHYQGFLKQDPDNHLWRHKMMCHPDQDVTFSMRCDKKHFSSFERMCRETIIIESLEEQGGCLNSKVSGYNRCSIPRLRIMMGDKIIDDKVDNDPPDVDEDSIFQEHAKRTRKKARTDEPTTEARAQESLHPPKRRKFKFKPKCTNGYQPDVSDENSSKVEGMSGPAHKLDEQKQVDTESNINSSLHSNSPSNFFSIFNKVNPKQKTMDSEQGRRKRNSRISKKSPPDFKCTKITEHFRPK